MDLKLDGKKALVMGSSQGIGKAIAQALVREKATVALCSRNSENLSRAASQIGAAHHFVCDLSQPGQGSSAVQQAIKKMGSVDILVLNSGGPKKGAFLDVTLAQWQEDIQTLWTSAVEALSVALPAMREKRFGRVIGVSSIAAKEPLPGLTTSNSLRAGLAGMFKSLATEYAMYGITFNLILPGYTDTERLQELNLPPEKIRQMVPAGRLAEPIEMGDVAAFLSSPLAGYITGQSIAVDGGATRSH